MMAERYEFIRKVAQGGFGRVYVARDTRLGREVAIKRLLEADHTEAQDQAEATFQREATTLAAMQHPNIVQIFDFDRDEEGSFVVMELLNGETLKERLDRGPLSWNTFVSVARQTLDAINAAHSKDILHRDLKPENLFLQRTASGSRIVKVLDFGLAKLSQAPSKQTMDQQGNVFGSIYYMAPEQFRREALDARTDLYALGCVFYQALTQRFPFYGEKMHETMEAHLQHKVKHLRERRPDINGAVADWVMRLISAKPSDRPLSALAALKELEAALEGSAALSVEVVPVAPAATTTSVRPLVPKSAPPPRATASSGGARTTSSVASSGVSKTPMQMRAISALEASRAEARAKMEAATKRTRLAAMIGVPIVVAAVVLVVMTRPHDKGSPPSAPKSSPAPQSAPAAGTVRPDQVLPSAALLTLPREDLLAWRLRAGVDWWHKGGDGKKPNAPPLRWQNVHGWRNIAVKGADAWLYEGKAERAAKALDAEVVWGGGKHPYLYFPASSGMEAKLPASEASLMPGGPRSDPQGLTVAAVFRANRSSKEPKQRPVLLTSTKNSADFFTLGFSHHVGHYWALVQRGTGNPAQSLVRPPQFERKGAEGNWVAASATWEAKRGTVRILVRTPDGKLSAGPLVPVEPGMLTLDRLNVGVFNPPQGSKLDQKERMDGDIIEIAIYRQALDNATEEKVVNALWDRYFKKR